MPLLVHPPLWMDHSKRPQRSPSNEYSMLTSASETGMVPVVKVMLD